MKAFKNIVKSFNQRHSDLKAEVIISNLLEKKVDIHNLEVIFEGNFERNYNKDLTKMYLNMVDKVIALHITRNSLYDNLPEGLFHPVTRYSRLDTDSRKKEFLKQREEEKKARKFFRPFDKEFLLQKTHLEAVTRKLLQDPFSEMDKWFPGKNNVPDNLMRQLIKYLPFTNGIKGNIDLTKECLSSIIGEHILAKSYYKTIIHKPERKNETAMLYDAFLGENLICGNSITDNVLVWEFIIDLCEEQKLEQYIDPEKGYMMRFIERFYDYFIPLEIKMEIKVNITSISPFYLNSNDDSARTWDDDINQEVYLGYNTIL